MRKPSLSALKIPTLTASKYHSVLFHVYVQHPAFINLIMFYFTKYVKILLCFFRVDGTLLSDCTRTLRVVWYLGLFHLLPLKMREILVSFQVSTNQSSWLTISQRCKPKKSKGSGQMPSSDPDDLINHPLANLINSTQKCFDLLCRQTSFKFYLPSSWPPWPPLWPNSPLSWNHHSRKTCQLIFDFLFSLQTG